MLDIVHNFMDPEQQKVYNQAVKYLSMRSHTIFELRTKLSRKKYPVNIINEVIDQLVASKYLNDRDFAQMFAQNLVKYKTFGYFGVKMKLKQRGVPDKMAEEVLDEEMGVAEETKIARRAIGKKLAAEVGAKDRVKMAQMLQRKGFRSQVIAAVMGSEFGSD